MCCNRVRAIVIVPARKTREGSWERESGDRNMEEESGEGFLDGGRRLCYIIFDGSRRAREPEWCIVESTGEPIDVSFDSANDKKKEMKEKKIIM